MTDHLSPSEQARLTCTCGHRLARHHERGCIDCGEPPTGFHAFQRQYHDQFCTGCGTGEQRCLAYGPGRKCCPDCEHIAALEEPTPGYRNGNPARGEVWYTPDCGHLHLSSPISDTDGGHDDR